MMNIQITLSFPETTYKDLQAVAAQHGQSPENYLLALSEQALAKMKPATQEEDLDLANDPLLKLAGFLDSGTPDLGERHDFYLAEAYADDHNDEA